MWKAHIIFGSRHSNWRKQKTSNTGPPLCVMSLYLSSIAAGDLIWTQREHKVGEQRSARMKLKAAGEEPQRCGGALIDHNGCSYNKTNINNQDATAKVETKARKKKIESRFPQGVKPTLILETNAKPPQNMSIFFCKHSLWAIVAPPHPGSHLGKMKTIAFKTFQWHTEETSPQTKQAAIQYHAKINTWTSNKVEYQNLFLTISSE